MKLSICHQGLWPIIVCINHDSSWVDLDLFNGKINFCHIGFSVPKVKTLDFSRSFVGWWTLVNAHLKVKAKF